MRRLAFILCFLLPLVTWAAYLNVDTNGNVKSPTNFPKFLLLPGTNFYPEPTNTPDGWAIRGNITGVVGGGGATNWSAGNTTAVRIAVVSKGTNNTGAIKTLSASGAITLTEEGDTNVIVGASAASGEANVNGEIAVTNGNVVVGLVAGKVSITNLLRSIQSGNFVILTNQGTNIVIAVDTGLTNNLATIAFVFSIGANTTNYVDSRSVNLTNAINAVSSACSNLAYAVGANDTNFAYSIGANDTNYINSRAVNLTNAINSVSSACSNLAYAVGANDTNFTYSIGANDTNYINSRAVNLTNALNSISSACSNLAYAVGANGTNFTYSIGANDTNYINSRSVNLTNAINSVSSACSNLAYAIGANGTNYAISVTNSPLCTNWINFRQVAAAALSNIVAISEVDGDLIVRTNGIWSKLPKGTANQVVKMDATGTFPAWGTDATGGGGGDWFGINTSQFSTNGSVLSIVSGVPLTNPVISGTLTVDSVSTPTLNVTNDITASNAALGYLTVTNTAVVNLISNLANVKWKPAVPSITQSNLVLSFLTNRYYCDGLTNLVLTNIVEELHATVSTDLSIFVRNTNGVNCALVWPAYGIQHGYFFRTNIYNPVLAWAAVTNNKSAVISLTCWGTNVFATITEWP
jgi:hypothetical protein